MVPLKQYQRAVVKAKAYHGEARQLGAQLRRALAKAAKLKKAATALRWAAAAARAGLLGPLGAGVGLAREAGRGRGRGWRVLQAQLGSPCSSAPLSRSTPQVPLAAPASPLRPPPAAPRWRRSGASGGSCRRPCGKW